VEDDGVCDAAGAEVAEDEDRLGDAEEVEGGELTWDALTVTVVEAEGFEDAAKPEMEK
jgi:hypothetical protein